MGAIASQITSLTIVYSTVYWDADQRKHQSSASLAFVRGIHQGQVSSLHKRPVTRRMFPFDDVIVEKVFSLRWHLHENLLVATTLFYCCYYCFMPREGRHFRVNTYNAIMTLLSHHVFGGLCLPALTHWGRGTHLCISKQVVNCLDNGLSPGRRQDIICWIIDNWTLINKIQWNLNRNLNIFIKKSPF